MPGSFTNNGTISGFGTLNLNGGTLTNNGSINPGGMNAAGTLSVTGSVVMGAGSQLNIELAGTGGGQYDVLAVSGSLASAGNLNLTEISGFALTGGQSFTPVTFGSNTGNFVVNAPIGTGLTPTYNPTNLVLGVTGVFNTWTFNGGGAWDLGTNWSRGHAPLATEDAVVGEIAGNATVSLGNAGQVARSVTLSGTDDVLFLGTGGHLALGNGNSAVTNLTLAGGNLTATGTVTVTNSLNWNTGLIDGAGALVTANTSTALLVPTGTKTLVNKTWDQFGTVTWNGGTIDLQGTSVINNQPGGIFNMTLTGPENILGASGVVRNFAGATINVSTLAGNPLIAHGRLDNNGSLNVAAGELSMRGPGTHAGAFNLSVGSSLRLDGSQPQDFLGTAAVTGGGVLEVAGAAVTIANGAGFTPDTLIVSDNGTTAGTVVLASGESLAVPWLIQSNGSISGSGGGDLSTSTGFAQVKGSITGFNDVLGVQSSGTLYVNDVQATNVVLQAVSGAIVAGGNAATNITATSANLVSSGAGGIGDTTPLQASVGSLRFDSGGGNVRIQNAGALDLAAGTSTSSGDVYLSAGGALTQSGAFAFAQNLDVSAQSITLTNATNNIGGTTSFAASAGSATIYAGGSGTFGSGSAVGAIDLRQLTPGSLLTVNGPLNATAGGVILTADDLAINNTVSGITAIGVNTLSAGRDIVLGSISTGGAMHLSQAELSQLSAGGGRLQIGNPSNGNISAVGAVSIAPAAFATVQLITTGAINTGGNTLTAQNLIASTPSTIVLDTDVQNLAAIATSVSVTDNGTGLLHLVNGDTLDPFASFSGRSLKATAGPINLTTTKALSIEAPVQAPSGPVILDAGGPMAQSGAGTVSGLAFGFSSVGGANLGLTNSAANVSINNSGGGDVTYVSSTALLTVDGTSDGGFLDVINAGSINVASALTNSVGDVSVIALGGSVSVGPAVTVSSGAAAGVDVQGTGVTNLGTIQGGAGGVLANAMTGALVNGGAITNSGSASQVTLSGDTMSLAGGSVNSGSGMLLVRSTTDAQPITLGAGPGLSLSAADLATLVGALQIGATTHAGGILVNAPIARATSASTTLYTNGGVVFGNDFNVSGGGSLSVIGGAINVANGSVQASSIFLSGSSITVQPDALATGNASVVAANNLSINAGTLTLRGSDTTMGYGAKLQAANSIVIGATSITIAGGNMPGASASIDPQSVTIASTGNLVLQGGAGAGSVAQVTGNTVAMTGANIQLLGGSGDGSYALVDSGTGGTTIAALSGGTIQLAAGTGLNANAGVVSLGAVNTGSTTCATCAVLTSNPYAPPTLSATGFYGAAGVLIPTSAAAGGSGGTGGAVLDEVLVLLVNNAVQTVKVASSSTSTSTSTGDDDSASGTTGGGTDDDQKKRKKNVQKCN